MNNFNKWALTGVAFMSYMIMSGMITQIGVLVSSLAEYLSISVTDAAVTFSYLSGGTLVGTFVSMAAYSRFCISKVMRINYFVFVSVIVSLVVFDYRNIQFISCSLFILGACCGVGLAGGSVVLSKLYDGGKRTSAFIATDCAFSASGFIFPTLASLLIAANVSWVYGYGSVSILAIIILLLTFILAFPKDDELSGSKNTSFFKQIPKMNNRVYLMGAALCMYLIAQNSFLTWSPHYLQEVFKLDPVSARSAVGNYWGPSIIGLIISAFVVQKVSPRGMLLFISFMSVVITSVLVSLEDPNQFLTVTLALGFVTTCMYKIAISIGTQQMKDAPALLVTFLLCCGTVGSTIAPALSAKFVEYFGVKSAMIMTMGSYLTTFVLLIIILYLEKVEVE
ncbi:MULTISPECIES: MFS transporter TsgA [Gammaproteobacteria]|uniref:MFS transporter TsgA n=1 Tax=Gammaproteobacteria TaxID=1236 RepID=UPI00191FF941|nr:MULTISPECIES: MFS transporter TsgA [Gammaproteobacteria]EKF9435238.1 MFS transporter TsgA [Vibrio cholerae]ELJ8545867.1 MFS transporter TsgA [Vibrio cholerae]ELJ8749909.1 MFS transporter TsgA [Vibrio cholerae]MBL0630027.1 MFS transporter TsgA [Aeromonas veronii]MCX9596665.1 MFS transporter TsgA [Vibrio cholerae]